MNGTYGRTFKTVTPYLTVTYGNTLDQGKNNDGVVAVEANVYKQFNKKLGASLGVGYAQESDQYARRETYGKLEFNYAFTDKCALELGGIINFKEKQDDTLFRGRTYNFEGKDKYKLTCKVILSF